MVAMNANEDAVSLDRDRFAEILDEFEVGINVMSGNEIDVSEDIKIDGKTALIWELE
jgi:predicted component of type VI protein secretion system